MGDLPNGRVEVQAILATDQPLTAYGGIQLSLEALHQLAEHAMRPGAEMLVDHDRSRPLNASNVHAHVRWNEGGWHEVFMQFEADGEAWSAFDAERAALGVRGGMSFSTFAPLGSGGTGDRPAITLAGDAHHFSSEDLRQSGSLLLPAFDVELKHLYQFSSEPLAKVVVEYAIEILRATPPDLLASLIYDALKGLIAKRRKAGGTTTVDFLVTESEGVRLTRATVTTDSEAVALRAIEAWTHLAPGGYAWDEESGTYRST